MDAVQTLASVGSMVQFQDGEAVFHRGETAENFYLILSGAVLAGREECGPGSCIGHDGFFGSALYSHDAAARGETLLLGFDRKSWPRVEAVHPRFYQSIMERAVGPRPASILPDDHPELEGQAPKAHDAYIFFKEVQCPLCSGTNSAGQIRSSRLRLQRIEPDFRHRYLDFEPLWHTIWVCPHCWYALPSQDLPQTIRPAAKQCLQEALRELNRSGRFRFSHPRTLKEVAAAYYLAVRCAQLADDETGREGMLWLRLAWIYRDAGEDAWAADADSKALGLLEESCLYSVQQRTGEQEQRLQLLVGELCLRCGRMDDALRYIRGAYRPQNGHRRLNRQAQDRVQDLRQWS